MLQHIYFIITVLNILIPDMPKWLFYYSGTPWESTVYNSLAAPNLILIIKKNRKFIKCNEMKIQVSTYYQGCPPNFRCVSTNWMSVDSERKYVIVVETATSTNKWIYYSQDNTFYRGWERSTWTCLLIHIRVWL